MVYNTKREYKKNKSNKTKQGHKICNNKICHKIQEAIKRYSSKRVHGTTIGIMDQEKYTTIQRKQIFL